jgi:hypothetical protein
MQSTLAPVASRAPLRYERLGLAAEALEHDPGAAPGAEARRRNTLGLHDAWTAKDHNRAAGRGGTARFMHRAGAGAANRRPLRCKAPLHVR